MELPYDAADLELKLLPESMRLSLMRAGTLLAGWEMVKSIVVNNIKDFLEYGDTYQNDVASQVRPGFTIFDASTAWYIEMEALGDEDVEVLQRLRDHRNEVAHEIMKFLVDPTCQVDPALLRSAHDVIRRLGQFWGRIHMDTDPRWDGIDVDPEEIKSGFFILFHYVLSLVDELEAE